MAVRSGQVLGPPLTRQRSQHVSLIGALTELRETIEVKHLEQCWPINVTFIIILIY